MARGQDSGSSPARQVGRGNPLNPGHYTPQPSVSLKPVSPGKPIYDAKPVGGQKRDVPAGSAVSRVSPAANTPTIKSETARTHTFFGPEGHGLTRDDGSRGSNNHLPHEIAHNNPQSRAYTQRQAPVSGTGQPGDFYGAKPEVIQLAQMRVSNTKAITAQLMSDDHQSTKPAAKLVDKGMRMPDSEMSPLASEVKVGKATKSQVESAFSRQQNPASVTNATQGRTPLSGGASGPVAPARSIGEVAGTKSGIGARPPRRTEKAFSRTMSALPPGASLPASRKAVAAGKAKMNRRSEGTIAER